MLPFKHATTSFEEAVCSEAQGLQHSVRHYTVQDPSAREVNEPGNTDPLSAVSYHMGISSFAGNKLETVYKQEQNFPNTSTNYR